MKKEILSEKNLVLAKLAKIEKTINRLAAFPVEGDELFSSPTKNEGEIRALLGPIFKKFENIEKKINKLQWAVSKLRK